MRVNLVLIALLNGVTSLILWGFSPRSRSPRTMARNARRAALTALAAAALAQPS